MLWGSGAGRRGRSCQLLATESVVCCGDGQWRCLLEQMLEVRVEEQHVRGTARRRGMSSQLLATVSSLCCVVGQWRCILLGQLLAEFAEKRDGSGAAGRR